MDIFVIIIATDLAFVTVLLVTTDHAPLNGLFNIWLSDWSERLRSERGGV